jgi:uncharacterized protein with von Willebrand factor type A (vWA) domain
MIDALARFVNALRAEGVEVSAAEAIDAARAVEVVGLERREGVRLALSATLAKDRVAREVFGRVFDRFFAPPRLPREGKGKGRPAGAREGERRKRTSTPPEESKRRTPSDRESERAKLGRRPGRLRKIVREERRREVAPEPARRPLTRRMATEEEREIAREIPRLLQALRLRRGRRRREARAGRPWLRKALRRSTATQGVPFVLPAQRPRRRGVKVVLLVDVSWSVARAAGFFLLLSGAFLELGRRARVVCFVDRPVEATDAIARWLRGKGRGAPRGRAGRPGDGIARAGVSFADVLSGIDGLNLDAASDYGRALHALPHAGRGVRGRDTLLVVLGDARANRFDPLPWAFEDLARGLGGVLWLIPEPASRWGTGDSALPAYLPSIDVLVEATDLEGLARGVAEMRKRI